MNFTIVEFRELLKAGASRVFWRHDVDCDLAAAVEIATIERYHDIEATFYLWARSPFYNLFGPEGQLAVRTLQELGHRLGLHVDLALPRDAEVTDDHLLDALECDYALAFEAYGDIWTGGFSVHRPPCSALWRDLAGVEYAYASCWEGRYLSDSRRELAADAFDRCAVGGVQANLHPEHWVYPGGDWLSARERRHRRALDELMERPPASVSTSNSWWPYAGAHGGMRAVGAC